MFVYLSYTESTEANLLRDLCPSFSEFLEKAKRELGQGISSFVEQIRQVLRRELCIAKHRAVWDDRLQFAIQFSFDYIGRCLKMKICVSLSKNSSTYRDLEFPFVCITGGKDIDIPVDIISLREKLGELTKRSIDISFDLGKICEWLAEATVVRLSSDCAENGLPDAVKAAIQKVSFTFRNAESFSLDEKNGWITI